MTEPQRQYLSFLNDECFLVQIIELHEKNGNFKEADYIRNYKNYTSEVRKNMKPSK